ncbi:MAG: hypothetical protein GY751_25470 [Bacteroidetes bacterium]|nr:hypothetical protein [Bacteroidota bacterium]
MATTAVQAQVAEYAVICDNSQVEVVSSAELTNYPNATILKDKLPSRAAANGWITSNQSLIACGAKATPAVPPNNVTPPPAIPNGNDVQAPPPPEKKVEHIYPNKFAFFGTVLFPMGDWKLNQAFYNTGERFVPFTAGFNFLKGNKAKFGFEMSFQGLSKVTLLPFDPDNREMLATATTSFLFSYPVAVDKQGRFWVVPQLGVGVDFFDVMQLFDKDDKLIASPSMLLRVGVQMYHLMPYFYYGQTFMDPMDMFYTTKPSHIGVGLAVTF